VNGVGLALVIPAVSSMIADYHPPETRGRAFGMMSLTASLGGMAGAFYATNVGGTQLLGMEGWRFAFHAVAAVSLATSLFVYKLAVDPRHLYHHPSVHAQHSVRSGSGGSGSSSGRPAEGPLTAGPAPAAGADVESQKAGAPLRVAALLSARRQILRDIASVLRVRSFQILVLQVCCTPPSRRQLALLPASFPSMLCSSAGTAQGRRDSSWR
jgi:MFS family permease